MQQNTAWPSIRFVDRLYEAVISLSDRTFILLVLVLFVVLSAPFFLHWPPPMADEEMFGDVARTLGEEGRLASTLVAGQERGMYWQPPLYFLLLAPVIQLAGWSLAVVRGFSAAVGMLVVIFTYLTGLSLATRPAARVGTLLLLFNPHFVTLVKYGRMDALCVLFVLISLLLARRAMERTEPAQFILPGFFAAAALLTHPLGFIAPLSILLWSMLGHRTPPTVLAKRTAWFLLPTVLGLGLWLLFILQDPQAFLVQMQYQFTRKDRGWSGFFLGFIGRYRYLPLVLASGVLGFLAAWQVWRRSGRNGTLLLLLIAALVSFVVIGIRFELPYHIYWTSFAGLVAGVAVTHGSWQWRSVLRLLALASLLNGLAFFAYVAYAIHWKERSAPDYCPFSRSVASLLPDSCSVMTAGYPSLYWGLLKERPDIRYVEKVYFDSTMARDVVNRLDYFICTRSFAPAEDAVEMARQVQVMDSLAVRVDKKLLFVGGIGEERRFVASANVYRLVTSSRAVRSLP